MRLSLGLVLFALAVSGCRDQCASDANCPAGTVCIHFALRVDDQGSVCLPLCDGGACAAGQQCTGCPESAQRCRRDDGTPSGGFCCVPGTQCL